MCLLTHHILYPQFIFVLMIFYSILNWSLPCNLDTHTVDTNVVNIVSLIEDNDTIPSKFFADNLCNLWIQKIMVAIDDNICLLNGPTSKEVRTPALRQEPFNICVTIFAKINSLPQTILKSEVFKWGLLLNGSALAASIIFNIVQVVNPSRYHHFTSSSVKRLIIRTNLDITVLQMSFSAIKIS